MAFPSLKNHFLIAMPSLADANFTHTVSLICEHTEDGALGLVINKSLDLSVGEVLGQLGMLSISSGASEGSEWLTTPVHWGGPVQPERGFVLYCPVGGDWNATMEVSPSLSLCSSKDILEAIARGEGPQSFLFALGYAGWGPGQLEQEILANSWLHGPAEEQVLFETAPDDRWRVAAEHIGVNLNLISQIAGHA